MAEQLGLSQEGYPNVAVYDPDAEFIGRLVGFGGRDPWFDELKSVVDLGERLAKAKADAASKPEAWGVVAEMVLDIPGRAKDAVALLDKVPAKARKSKEFKALEARIAARSAWLETDAALDELMQGVRSREAAKEKAPAAIGKLDAFLKANAGKDDVSEPMAIARKGWFLVLSDRQDDAVAAAKELLDRFPKSEQARALLNGLR